MSITTVIVPPGGGLDTLRISSSTPREPGPGEITVRLHACSLNYHDYVVVSGAWPPREPRIPLSDGAGVVTAVGAGVADLAAGDQVVSLFFPEWVAGTPGPREANFARVPGDGIDGYARTEVTTAATAFTRSPRGYSHAEAASLPLAGSIAWDALAVAGGLQVGETVLIHGAGGVGSLAVQIARASGAYVLVVCSDYMVETVNELGADVVIDRHAQDFEEVVGDAVRDGVDLVLDTVGGGTLNRSIGVTRDFGVMVGIVSTSVDLARARANNLVVQKLFLQRGRYKLLALHTLVKRGHLRPVVDSVMPLVEVAEAHRRLQEGGVKGKLVLQIAGE